MKADRATRLAKQLRRYEQTKRGSKWDPKGRFVVQAMIPVVSKAVESAVIGIMANAVRTARTEAVPIDKVWSTQRHLRIRSLLYQIKQFKHSQRGYYKSQRGRVTVKRETDLPTFFYYAGKYVLWNGNHRTSAGLLLGRSSIRGRVYRLRKKRG
jgi:hypothetical protein